PVHRPRLTFTVAAATASALVLGACRPGAGRVDFRPSSGSTYTYAIDVKAATTTAIDGRAPSRSENDEHLEAHHLVQDGDGAAIDVRVTAPGGAGRPSGVPPDGAASLVAVPRIEDTPSAGLGDLGLRGVFPAGAGALPDRKLRRGSSWRIEEPVTLPG